MARCLFGKPRRPVVSAITHYFNPGGPKYCRGNLIKTELAFCSCEDTAVIKVTLRRPVKDNLLLLLTFAATASNGQEKGDRLTYVYPFICRYNSTDL